MFNDVLILQLDLMIGNNKFKIPGGQIKKADLHLWSYGFDATVEFWISGEFEVDTLYSAFIEQDIIEARLSVEGAREKSQSFVDPLVIKGLVTEKRLYDLSSKGIKGQPVLHRKYTLHFKDAARVLWRQHFPSVLYVDENMGKVFKSQTVEGISLVMDFLPLLKQHPVICLSLGDGTFETSFYDFLIWYVTHNHGVFYYEHKNAAYHISNLKNTTGNTIELIPREITSIEVIFPETPRHTVKVLNTSTEQPKSEDLKQTQDVAGIRQTCLVRTPLANAFDEVKTLETQKLTTESTRFHEIEVILKEFPERTFRPGIFAKLDTNLWSKNLYSFGKTYRLIELQLHLDASGQPPTQNYMVPHNTFEIEMIARFEDKNNPFCHLPSFTPPRFPIQAEGKIVSEVGETKDKSYQIYTDSATSQDYYTINVPIWNQDVRVLFEPDFLMGHFYFPAFKNARVLLDLYFDRAEINRFLDWGADVRLPMDPQGNHILFGMNTLDEASVKYDYVNKKPVFNIKRTFDKDTELIQMEEGTLILQTQEEEVGVTADQTFNLVPEVEATRIQLVMENEASVGDLTSNFENAKSGSNAAIENAMSETEASLTALDAEVSAKMNEINATISAAMAQLSKTEDALKAKAKAAVAELKALGAL